MSGDSGRFRQNGEVPRVYVPPSSPSDEVRAAMSVFQVGALRAEIIRDLARHPAGSTTREIAARVGVISQQVYRHIGQLKDDGVVIDVGQGTGYRRGPVYQLDREALEAKSAAFMSYLLGE